MRASALTAALLVLWNPASAEAQRAGDVLDGIRNGGGWVAVPIEGGSGEVRTLALPTVGLTLSGCVNVWAGHSGAWEITARDNVTDSVLEVSADPGVGVLFSHTFGMQAQLDFEFRWSEPRDTTLLLWVGLGMGEEPESASCQPRYSGG